MAESTLKPLADRVVVRPLSKEEQTASGIILPDTASKEKPQEGEVLAVGPGKLDQSGKRIALEVEIGNRVLFSKYSPTEVEVDGEELLVVSEGDILAVIK